MPRRPNLLFLMCDELRAFEVGCYGHRTLRTPNIDALARRGTRFDVAVSNCPVCMPARSVVLSGQYARTCNGYLLNTAWHPKEGGWIMPQWPRPGREHCRSRTLPEALRDAGYRTHAVGKWHVEAWPGVLGFDYYVIPAHQHANSAQWYVRDGGPVYVPDGFGLDHEVDEAIAALTDHADDRPRFVYLNLGPPHMPLLDAPQEYLDMYTRDDVVPRDNVRSIGDEATTTDTFLTYLWDYRYYRDRLPYCTTLPEGCDLIELHRLYYGLTSWVDDALGRVVAALEAAGRLDDTLIVFTSDHGENLASHGRMGKASPNEEAIRVPLVVAGPGVEAGRVSGTVASLVDTAPTLLEAAGVETPGHMQGRSLSASLGGRDRAGDDNLAVFENIDHGVGVRSATHTVNLPWSRRFTDVDIAPRPVAPEPDLASDVTADPFQIGPSDIDAPEAVRLAEFVRRWDRDTPWGP